MPIFKRLPRSFNPAVGSDNDSDSSSDVFAKSQQKMSAQLRVETAGLVQTERPSEASVHAVRVRQQTHSRSPSTPLKQPAPVSVTSESPSSSQETQSGLTIQDLWDDAEANFKNLTGVPLQPKSGDGIKDVMSRLDVKYGTGATGKGAKTKKIVTNIVEVIKNLGGIAVQGASMVFGPADICFNAVTFLLEIPAKIDKLFGSVSDLFERLNDYLMKLEIYKRIEKDTKIPYTLLHFTNKVLAHFVDVCALAYGLAFGTKLAKAKAAFLVGLANDDSGLSAALKNFDSLIARQNSLELSENLAATLNVAKNTQSIPAMASNVTEIRESVEMLVSDQASRSVEKYFHDQRESIAENLGIEKSAVSEQEELMKGIRSGLRNSGSELAKNGDYQKWASFMSDARPTIFLVGEQRYGREYIMDAILNDMESKNASDSDLNAGDTIIVGYYIFQKKDERSLRMSDKDNPQNKRPIETALKHICLQIANRTKAYMREISTSLQTLDVGKRSAAELWDDLSIGRPRSDNVHLLVFEGIDQVSEAQAGTLFKIIDSVQKPQDEHQSAFNARSRVRILVSGYGASFPSSYLLNVPRLFLGPLNVVNLSTFIDQDLDSQDFKEAVGDDENLKVWIRDNLPEASKGDFPRAQRALASLKSAIRDGDDIERAKDALLDACNEDWSVVASNIIQDLSKSLSKQDVNRLNVLLMWAIFGLRRFTLRQMRALSYLSTGDNPYLPFHQIVRTKYTKVFDIEQETESTIVRPVVRDYFMEQRAKRSPQLSHSNPKEAKISLEIKIQNASVSQVKRFLWSLNEQVNFDGSMFQSTESQIEERAVEVYEADSVLSITMKCLELLNDEVNEITEPLFAYVVATINSHLHNLWALYDEDDLISVEEVKQVQTALIAFLSDVDMLDKHYLPGSLMRKNWLDESRGRQHIISILLNVAEGTELLHRRDKRLLGLLMDAEEGHLSFYKPITLLMAGRWLQSSDHDAHEMFDWVDGYIVCTETRLFVRTTSDRSRSPRSSSTGRTSPAWSERSSGSEVSDGERPPPREITNADRVERAIVWARKHLAKPEENSLWYRRIAETFKHVGENQAAVKEYEKALHLDPNNWMLYKDIAEAYADMGNFKEAISKMLQGLEITRKNDPISLNQRDSRNERELSIGSIWLIDWLIKEENYDDAVKECEKALSVDPYDTSLQVRMLQVLQLGQKDTKSIRKFIIENLAEPHKDQQYSKLVNLVQLIATEYLDWAKREYSERLVSAVQEAEAFPQLLDAIQQTSELVRDTEGKHFSLSDRTCLLFKSSILALRDGPGDLLGAVETAAKALTTDEEGEDGSKWWSRSKDEDAVSILRLLETLMAGSFHRLITRSIKAGNMNFDEDLDKFRIMATTLRARPEPSLDYGGLTFYMSCAVAAGRVQKDRELLFPIFEVACEMLSNDTADDDLDAYYTLAQIFNCLQDEYNCRVAWSLYAPFDADVGLESKHIDTDLVLIEKSVRPQGHGLETINEDDGESDPTKNPVGSEMSASEKDFVDNNSVTNGEAGNLKSDQTSNTVNSNALSPKTEAPIGAQIKGGPLADGHPAATTNTNKDPEISMLSKNEISSPANELKVNDVHDEESSSQDEDDSDSESSSTLPADRPTFIRVRREWVCPTTANKYRVSWVFDPENHDFIIIKRYISVRLQQGMFAHTRKLKRMHGWFQIDCANSCGRTWWYASDLYMCRYCQSMILCGGCQEKVASGRLKRRGLCHPEHEWLYIPRWSNEHFRQLGRGKVRVGGTIGQDGYIEDGEVVDWRVWLNGIRKEWGLPEIERWKEEITAEPAIVSENMQAGSIGSSGPD